jgi:4-amino-4-deoxy-L-arabinose transferase-like glycosyltransferase
MRILISDKLAYRLSLIVIALGIVLRTVTYIQNRCLFIDEANVARNIFERSFVDLAKPLNYEQYAPPVFLWIVKCCTLLFGYSEYAYRLFPFICGIASILLMFIALRKFAGNNGIWYALTILSTGVIYIRYASELKQYGCDVAVTLSMIILALSSDIFKMQNWKFIIFWFIIGSVAIWLSMPSVFILTGVGVYYLYQCIHAHQYKKILTLSVLGLLWIGQFSLYYLVILKPQIQSDYLQNCHKEFFLYAIPNSGEKLEHNINVFNKMLAALGGKWTLSIIFHLATFVVGIVWLSKKQFASLLLIIVPLLALIIAAMTNQYALTPRLILFIMPLLLLPIAAGLHALFLIKYYPVKALLVISSIICIVNFGGFNLLFNRMENEELTKNLEFLKQQKITGPNLYVHNLAGPAYIYYTTIHPEKAKWNEMANAHILFWNSNYDSLSQSIMGTSALLYSWAPDDEIAAETNKFKLLHKEISRQVVTGSQVYIYQ